MKIGRTDPTFLQPRTLQPVQLTHDLFFFNIAYVEHRRSESQSKMSETKSGKWSDSRAETRAFLLILSRELQT